MQVPSWARAWVDELTDGQCAISFRKARGSRRGTYYNDPPRIIVSVRGGDQDDDFVRYIVLHEVAHYLATERAGYRVGHRAPFYDIALDLYNRYLDEDALAMALENEGLYKSMEFAKALARYRGEAD